MQTVEGAAKMMETIKNKFGVDKDGKSLLHVRIGAQGGKKSRNGGFYANRELARIAGAKGGAKSRRGKAIKQN